jgi:hypothetical protein
VARTFSRATLSAELARARANGWHTACAAGEREGRLPAGLLLAIASQETDMNDVVGDGGHGRGLFQIDDRAHPAFLRQQGASGAGRRPPVPAAAAYAAGLLRANLDFGVRNGVPERLQLKFALSAYNAGAGGALSGFREGDSDRRTTGGDYGKAVLGRHAIFQGLLGVAPPPLLKVGSRNAHVTKLKDELRSWFDKHAPGTWEGFRVKPGPFFGVRVETAVKEFQRRMKLEIDGRVGEDTRGALEAGRKPKRS